MLDSEAADKAENEASEVEQMRVTLARYEEENKLMMDEIAQLKEMLKREVAQAESDKKRNLTIINNYKLIKQKLENVLQSFKVELDSLKVGGINYTGCFQIYWLNLC